MRELLSMSLLGIVLTLITIQTGNSELSDIAKLLPVFNDGSHFNAKKIEYIVFTRSNKTKFGVKMSSRNPLKSGFNPELKTVILVHGTAGSASGDGIVLLKESILKQDNVNVIICDWGFYAQQTMDVIIKYYKVVGHALAKFLTQLQSKAGVHLDNVHIIGHSVGVHVAAFASRNVPGKVHRITGLDPSDLRNVMKNRSDFILPNDAGHVDCIRTSIFMGLRDHVCGCDYYANNGITQLGCKTQLCDHFSSLTYYANSIAQPKLYLSYKCKVVKEETIVGCNSTETAYAGYLGDVTCTSGVYQFNASISNEEAAGINHELAKIYISKIFDHDANTMPFENSNFTTMSANKKLLLFGNNLKSSIFNVAYKVLLEGTSKILGNIFGGKNPSVLADRIRTDLSAALDETLSLALESPAVF